MAWAIVAGAAVSAVGAYGQSQSQKKALGYQQEQAEQNAQLQAMYAQEAIADGNREAQARMAKTSQIKATQTAAAAANGLDVSQGTPQSILDDTQYFGDIDVANIKYNAQRKAWGFDVEGNNMSNTAAMYGAQAYNINPLMNGLMAGAGSIASNWGSISSSFKAKYGDAKVQPTGATK